MFLFFFFFNERLGTVWIKIKSITLRSLLKYHHSSLLTPHPSLKISLKSSTLVWHLNPIMDFNYKNPKTQAPLFDPPYSYHLPSYSPPPQTVQPMYTQRKNYTITFVNTPLNIKNLRSTPPANSSIHLLEIPFSSSNHGLPLDTENTNILPYHLFIHLIEASTYLGD